MSLRPQRDSNAPEIHTSMLPHLHNSSGTPARHTSIPPHYYTCSVPSDLRSSVPQCVHIYTPAARLQTFEASYLNASTSTRLRRASEPPAPYFNTSTSRRWQPASGSPDLQSSIPQHLHVYTAAARLEQSIHSYLHV